MKKKRIFAFLLTLIMMTGCCGCSASAKSMVNTANQKRINEMLEKGASYWEGQTAHQVGEAVTVTEYIRPLSYILQYPKTEHPNIDARIEAIVAEIRNAFEQEYLPPETDDKTKQEQKKEATLYLGYEAYLTNETHMSLLFFETHEVEMGMSPHTRIQAFHFDLEKDAEVAAEELIWKGFAENASAYTQNYFTSTEPYNQRIFGNYKTLLAPENGRFDRFAFTQDGVLFHFDRYDIFPGSMGIVSLLIPYEDMRAKLPADAEENETPAVITDKKMVALTSDDGPNPVHTNAILDILEKYDADALKAMDKEAEDKVPPASDGLVVL
ncbi:MAG: DUF3298 domain-containing protein, partial [Anaerotignum sp.]|nr:DUF3298 domain-containing protein [Anaerotignum sp.]